MKCAHSSAESRDYIYKNTQTLFRGKKKVFKEMAIIKQSPVNCIHSNYAAVCQNIHLTGNGGIILVINISFVRKHSNYCALRNEM